MDHAELTQHVRQIASAVLAERHPGATEPLETILLREGAYWGRSFQGEQVRAVWMIEEDRLIIVDEQCAVLRELNGVSMVAGVARKAA